MYFIQHLFFCTNHKVNGGGCGELVDDLGFKFAKTYLEALGLIGYKKYRVSKSGCLGRCDLGPVLVIYPEGVWYTYLDEADVKEIIDEYLIAGREVTRLKLPNSL